MSLVSAWVLALLWLGILVVLPVGSMALDAFTTEESEFTLANVLAFAADTQLLRAAANTFLVATGVALLSIVLGVPLAFGVARTAMRFKRFVYAAIVISLVSPDFLLAMAYVVLAGPNAGYFNLALRSLTGASGPGPLDVFTLWGLVLTALPHGVSFVFLSVTPALRNLDPALDEAARVHGAGSLSTVMRVSLPLVRPALVSGALLAFVSSLAIYGPAQMLRLNVLTVSIREALLRMDFKVASVASLALTLVSLVALALYRRSTGQLERFRTLTGKSFAARPFRLSPAATAAFTGLGLVYSTVVLVVPYGAMLLISLMKSVGEGISAGNWTVANYVSILTNPAVRSAAQLSLTLAMTSATLIVSMGLLVAFLIIRSKASGRALLDYVSILPLALPGTALGIALIVIYLNPPFNLLGFYGSFGILLVAYLTRFLTFGVRQAHGALAQVSPELEEAARLAGAGPASTLLRIVIPLLWQSLLYAWILVFVLAIPELSSSVILKGLKTQTLSVVLLDVWAGNGGLATASAFGISIFACVCTLLGLSAMIGRRAGIGFGP